MPRIEPLRVSEADGESKRLFESIQRDLGMVPNLLRTLGLSPAALGAYVSLTRALSRALEAPLREQIALTVAGTNRCDYCASAHTALGTKAGLDAEELTANLRGDSADAKVRAALEFSRAIVEERGHVSNEQLSHVRSAGYSDAEIVEIVAVVALNLFTNYLNHVASTEVDFPHVDTTNIDRTESARP